MPTIQKDKIIFNSSDWLAGLHPQYTTSAASNQHLTNKLAAQRAFDPFRNFGYASPGFQASDLTNVSVIDAVQVGSAVYQTYAYTVGGTKIHQINISTETITTPTTFPHAVSSSIMEDVVVYDVNVSSTRTKRLFYSWYDGTDGDVGVYDFSTTFDDDWMSTVPASAAVLNKSNPIPLIVGSNDRLYMADGNSIHCLDGATGANGTLTKNVLVLPKEYIITGFAKQSNNTLVIFAYDGSAGTSYYRGRATAFFWDYLKNDPYKKIDLDDNYVSAPFEYKGSVGCFTSGRPFDKTNTNKNTKLKIYDGSGFETVANIFGNPPCRGGVDVVGNSVIFISNVGTQGYVYQWNNNFTKDKELNIIGEASGYSLGLIKNISTGLQLVSTGTTTSGGLQNLNTNYFSSSLVSTSLAEPSWGRGQSGRIKGIKVKFAKTSTGGRGITLTLRDSTSSIGDIMANTETINSSNLIKMYYNLDGKQFDDLKLNIQWSAGSGATDAPIVDTIEVYFETINI